MAAGLGTLGLAPVTFWAMTPRELDAALKGRLGDSAPSRAPSRSTLDRLLEQFPDVETRR